MSWKRWPWLNDGVLPLTMVILRVCWLWLWLNLAQNLLAPSYPGTLLPAWLIGALLLGSQVATRWIMGRTTSLARARLEIAGLGLLVMFLVLWWQFYRLHYPPWDWRWPVLWGREMLFWSGEPPLSYLALPAVVYLWLRGIRDGSRPLQRRHVVHALAAGCLALVAFVLVAGVLEPMLPAGTGSIVFLFFAMAMIALALSGLNMAPVYEPGARFFNRYWLGSVLTIIAGLLVLGLLFSLLLSPEIVAQLLEWVWGPLSRVLALLFQLTILLLWPILYLLSRLLTQLSIFNVPRLPQLPPAREEEQNDAFDTLATAIERMPDEWRWVGLLLFIVGIGLIFGLVLRRLLAAGKEEIEETRELIFSRELLLAQLAQLWSSWLNPLGRQRPTPVDPFLSLAGEQDSRRLIRQAYQALLAAARERGLARERDQTPLEYRDELAQALPEESKVLAVITERYVQARYDLEPPTPEAAEQTRQAWRRIQAKLKIGD